MFISDRSVTIGGRVMGLLGISSVLKVMLAVSCSRVLSILVRSQLVGAALVSNDELPGHLDGWFFLLFL